MEPDDKREQMLALAERCEKAGGPDRELDHWIQLLVVQNGQRGAFKTDAAYVAANLNTPRVTASLDAALTLAPEGREVVVTRCADGSAYAEVGNMRPAATPALALCAASLRARADGGTDG